MACNGNELQTCGDNGQFQDSQACAQACSPTLGCVVCVPDTATCNGDVAHACNADGTGYTDETCDSALGETCDPAQGGCTGPCATKTLGQSYIGCEYYPTVTGNIVGDAFSYAVAISNTSATVATVTIDGGALTTPMVVMVQPNHVLVQTLPWQQALKMCNAADTPEVAGCDGLAMAEPGIVTKGAYHLRSDNPITLYQFNALEYVINGNDDSFSNDASLLLPTNVWRSSYYTASFVGVAEASYPGLMTVTATQPSTMVTINSRADTGAGTGIGALSVGTPQTVMLNAGDVLELTSDGGDFTGTKVDSSAPVQVIGGHFCTQVPVGTPACDHLEESMFGVDTLGTTYVVNAPAVASIPNGKVEVIRIVATQPGTTLTYDPPQSDALATIANAGDFIEINNNSASFKVTANNKILVAQYMEGQEAGGNQGDPAMTLAVPVEQFRTSYAFHAPITYTSNYVDITAPTGATVMLDGAPVPLTAIGTTGYSIGRARSISAGPANDGNHSITGDQGFAISVYGYGQYTAYWYPGGLNLTSVIN